MRSNNARFGAGGIIVMNLFAWVSPYPDDLYGVEDPVGPDTDTEVLDACKDAMHVICGWGNHGAYQDRGERLLMLLRANGVRPTALGINKDGSPRHPLYVGYDAPLNELA